MGVLHITLSSVSYPYMVDCNLKHQSPLSSKKVKGNVENETFLHRKIRYISKLYGYHPITMEKATEKMDWDLSQRISRCISDPGLLLKLRDFLWIMSPQTHCLLCETELMATFTRQILKTTEHALLTTSQVQWEGWHLFIIQVKRIVSFLQ